MTDTATMQTRLVNRSPTDLDEEAADADALTNMQQPYAAVVTSPQQERSRNGMHRLNEHESGWRFTTGRKSVTASESVFCMQVQRRQWLLTQ